MSLENDHIATDAVGHSKGQLKIRLFMLLFHNVVQVHRNIFELP